MKKLFLVLIIVLPFFLFSCTEGDIINQIEIDLSAQHKRDSVLAAQQRIKDSLLIISLLGINGTISTTTTIVIVTDHHNHHNCHIHNCHHDDCDNNKDKKKPHHH